MKKFVFRVSCDEGMLQETVEVFENQDVVELFNNWVLENSDAGYMDVTDENEEEYVIGQQTIGN